MPRAEGSIGNATGEQRAGRRQELLDAAHRVIRRDGPTASMDDVAAEAGITKPILYRHFGNKGGLYKALAERYVWALLTERRRIVQDQTDPHLRLRATIDAYLAFVEQDPQVYRFLAQHAFYERPEAQAALTDYIRTLAGDVAAELDEGLKRAGGNRAAAQPWAFGIIGLVQMATDWWLEDRSMSRAEFVDHLTNLLWTGMSRPEIGRARGIGSAPEEAKSLEAKSERRTSRRSAVEKKVGGPLRG
ncbi:MAG TPA: TetR/AcrR family transcriptional regulator [Actinomycetota bacterium]|nr:TetR/AcrR family transcriptional regulator [Actinomycetota bacterium]